MPLAIDLFCGLGGWTEGLLAEGYRVVGYDIEAHEYDGERYPAELVLADVLDLHGSMFADADLIVASPPCQFFNYTAMPWTRAKALAAEVRADPEQLAERLALFNACFRIQREAMEAAGHHIPLVVENVRGAIPWVGRSRWNYGSFHLWGDVPALMPTTVGGRKGPKVGHGWKHPDDPRHQPGLDFTRIAGGMRPPARISDQPAQEGRKSAGSGAEWFDQNIASLPSGSNRRKAASARIAKIPLTLSRWIAAHYYPTTARADDAAVRAA